MATNVVHHFGVPTAEVLCEPWGSTLVGIVLVMANASLLRVVGVGVGSMGG